VEARVERPGGGAVATMVVPPLATMMFEYVPH
jgi:hypothetical protein